MLGPERCQEVLAAATASASPLPGDLVQQLQLVSRSHFRNYMDNSGCLHSRKINSAWKRQGRGSRPHDKAKREVNTEEETKGSVYLACQEGVKRGGDCNLKIHL